MWSTALNLKNPFSFRTVSGHICRPSDHAEPKRIAWIQCVGSRDPSIIKDTARRCAACYATKEAIIAREHGPGGQTDHLLYGYQAHGKGFDQYYERAKTDFGVRYSDARYQISSSSPKSKNLLIPYIG
jgi:heterodisulfide reductase subunit A